MRGELLRAMVWAWSGLMVVTEVLSALGCLTAAWIGLVWGAIVAALWFGRSGGSRAFTRPRGSACAAAALLCLVMLTTLITAVAAPPNTWDALAYHLPRVVYWAQQGSVAFFPTTYQNQNGMPPAAEYAMLHSWLLTGSDRLVNLPQWLGFAGSVLAASLIAQRWGAGVWGQLLSALFCVSLPSAILQASGAKNDLVLALWLSSAFYFLTAWRQEGGWSDLCSGALAASLAIATKGTAYVFLPALVLAVCWPLRSAWRPVLLTAAAILLLNGPFYWRNYQASGSPLGFDSAHGDGRFRWRNEAIGWKPVVSNGLRHLSEQLGARSASWNQMVYAGVLRVHEALGLDPSDPATTWPGAMFAPPRLTWHEADANNRWHLLALLLVAPFGLRSRPARLLLFALCGAFVLFCVYLRWQPYQARLLVPLFVLASPLFGVVAERPWQRLGEAPRLALLAGLVLAVASPLFGNWLRPWRGPHSIWNEPRTEQYFADIRPWGSAAGSEQALNALARSSCRVVGVDSRLFEPEYPYLVLTRRAVPGVRFVRAGLVRSPEPRPCATLCLGCDAGPEGWPMGRSTLVLPRAAAGRRARD